jgi:hypothetical protein
LSAFAAQSAGRWLVGNQYGVVFDGSSSIASPRTLTLGSTWSVAAGTNFISVATASGKIFYFNATDDSQAGSIDFATSQLYASADGTVLAAMATTHSASTDRTVNVYSLPSGNPINTFPYSYYADPDSDSPLLSLSQTGTVIALGNGSDAPTCTSEIMVVSVRGGTPVYCLPVIPPVWRFALSPNGTLGAVSAGPIYSNLGSTNIYNNGTFTAAVPSVAVGWLDDNRLILNDYVSVGNYPPPEVIASNGTVIYDAAGKKVGTTPFLGLGPFQVVSAANNAVYEMGNTIVSLNTGATTWASGNFAFASASMFCPCGWTSAVSAAQVIFASDNLVLAQPY